MSTSLFDPVKNALPYENGHFKFKVGIFNFGILCGGISYAALDYFFAGIQPPQSPKHPSEGNPMQQYLYDRQATAHYYTWNLFANAWTFEIDVQDDIYELDALLSSSPVIICLYGHIFQGHHVVVTACDTAAGELTLFDSNHPKRRSYLTKTSDGKWRHSISGALWRGWFIDWGYSQCGTYPPPPAFRYCRTCHGLHTPSLGVAGGCLNGQHNDNPDLEYFLPWKSGFGQMGWKVCGNCMSLYRAGPGDTPTCPVLGMHQPQANNAFWPDLMVATTGAGEGGWSRCANCCMLCWNNNGDYGDCPDTGKHVPTGESYVLDCRTFDAP